MVCIFESFYSWLHDVETLIDLRITKMYRQTESEVLGWGIHKSQPEQDMCKQMQPCC